MLKLFLYEPLVRQTLIFYPGWNFFSSTVEPQNPSVDEVLSSIEGDFTEVWAFDSLDGEYKGYVPDKGRFDLTEIHTQKGYLIHIVTQTTLVVTGTKVKDDIPLAAGRNLIGCPADTVLPIEEALACLDGQFASLWSYDDISGKWRCYSNGRPTFLNDLKKVEPGKAYWVKMTANGHLRYLCKQIESVYFYHSDHLGSSNLITDINGNVAERTEFYPYGRTRYEERGDFDSAYKYTGKELDKETGLMYYGARYYEPVVGRFISVDPGGREHDYYGTQGLNIYAYCNNNPLKYIDPDGEFAIVTAMATGAGFVTLADYLLQWQKSGKPFVSYWRSGEYSLTREVTAVATGASLAAGAYYALPRLYYYTLPYLSQFVREGPSKGSEFFHRGYGIPFREKFLEVFHYGANLFRGGGPHLAGFFTERSWIHIYAHKLRVGSLDIAWHNVPSLIVGLAHKARESVAWVKEKKGNLERFWQSFVEPRSRTETDWTFDPYSVHISGTTVTNQ